MIKLTGITSDKQLIDLCDEFNIKLNFIGSKDLLKNHALLNGCYIINMENSYDGNGTHWVALYISNNSCYYMDSMGVLPPLEVIDFCKNNNIYYNKSQIQGYDKEYCGEFCIHFLKCMLKTGIKYSNFSDYIRQYCPINGLGFIV